MENASHALIMAGGILITLLILTIAVILYMTFNDSAQGITSTWDTAELTKFNSSFLVYLGRNDVTAQEIVSLITLSQQRGKLINVFVDNRNVTSWTIDEINDFLSKNLLITSIDETGVEQRKNNFSYVNDSIKYDEHGRVCEIRFRKN